MRPVPAARSSSPISRSVQLWICSDLDLATATVDFVDERAVVVQADDG